MTDKQLKEAVADAVFVQIGAHQIESKAGLAAQINNDRILSVEIYEISSLQRQVRVKTQSNGTHYYSIKIAEIM